MNTQTEEAMIHLCKKILTIIVPVLLITGCGSGGGDSKNHEERNLGVITANEAQLSIDQVVNNGVNFHYESKNINEIAISQSDDGQGVWFNYRIYNENNEIVWPPATGLITNENTYKLPPNESLKADFNWAGRSMPSFTRVPGHYTIKINDIFYGHVQIGFELTQSVAN